MAANRHSEEQIMGIFLKAAIRIKVGDVCRKYGIIDATYYKQIELMCWVFSINATGLRLAEMFIG